MVLNFLAAMALALPIDDIIPDPSGTQPAGALCTSKRFLDTSSNSTLPSKGDNEDNNIYGVSPKPPLPSLSLEPHNAIPNPTPASQG
jgi:hypothetical protein